MKEGKGLFVLAVYFSEDVMVTERVNGHAGHLKPGHRQQN